MAGNSMCGRVGLNVTLLWLYLFRHRYRILPEVSYHLRCIKLETKHSTKQTKAEHEAVSPYELSAQAKWHEVLATGLSSDYNKKIKLLGLDENGKQNNLSQRQLLPKPGRVAADLKMLEF